jgi:MinD-like ATPase involved in chromosome partitioning or flagellar assembly
VIYSEDVPVSEAGHESQPRIDSGLWARRVGVAVACGDPDAERNVLDAIATAGATQPAMHVIRRCLSAAELIDAIASELADVVVLGTDLHGLSNDVLSAVIRAHIPMIVLASRGLGEPTWDAHPHAVVLTVDATTDQLVAALESVTSPGFKPRAAASKQSPIKAGSRAATTTSTTRPTHEGEIIVVTGASGGVGCSTVAANLAAAIGRQFPTVLFEADLFAGGLAGALGLDPARNVCMLAHDEPGGDDTAWDRALAAELQSIDPTSPRAMALCGVPRPALRNSISTAFVEDLLDRLRARADFVIVDVPASCADATAVPAIHGSIIDRADRLLVVTAPDVVGLRRASLFAKAVSSRPGGSDTQARMSLVANRHRKANHADGAEIAAVLRITVAAIIPDDPSRLQRSLEIQRPAVACGASRGSAAYALEELGARVARTSSVPTANTGWWNKLRARGRCWGANHVA